MNYRSMTYRTIKVLGDARYELRVPLVVTIYQYKDSYGVSHRLLNAEGMGATKAAAVDDFEKTLLYLFETWVDSKDDQLTLDAQWMKCAYQLAIRRVK